MRWQTSRYFRYKRNFIRPLYLSFVLKIICKIRKIQTLLLVQTNINQTLQTEALKLKKVVDEIKTEIFQLFPFVIFTPYSTSSYIKQTRKWRIYHYSLDCDI